MCSSTGPALHSHQAGTGKPAGAGNGKVWGPQVSGARFRMRGAVSGVPGKPHTGPSRPLDKASGSPEEAEECDRNSTPAGAVREIRHASHAGMPHGAWLQLDAATGLQQYVGGHGTRLPGWGGCVSGPRFRLPGYRQTDRHNQVLNAEPRTRGQPSESGVNSKPAGESKDADIRKKEATPVSFRCHSPTRGLCPRDRDHLLSAAPTPDHPPYHGPRPFPRQGRRPACTVALVPIGTPSSASRSAPSPWSRSSSTPASILQSRVRFEARVGRLLQP